MGEKKNVEFPNDFTPDYHKTIFHFVPIFISSIYISTVVIVVGIIRYLLPVTEIPLLPLFYQAGLHGWPQGIRRGRFQEQLRRMP